jgi:Ca2+-binding EF-hand superfamily protein
MAKLTDLQRREQESIFELWDSDQDGYITQADLESRAQGLAGRFGRGLESRPMKRSEVKVLVIMILAQ